MGSTNVEFRLHLFVFFFSFETFSVLYRLNRLFNIGNVSADLWRRHSTMYVTRHVTITLSIGLNVTLGAL